MAFFGFESLKDKLGMRTQPTGAEVGTGAGVKCVACGELLMRLDFDTNQGVCSQCGHHHRIGARRRIACVLDPGSFEEHDAELVSVDALDFGGGSARYTDKLEAALLKTGLNDAMVSGVGRLMNRPVNFAVTDSDYMMGSMGSVMGEKFARLAENAIEHRRALITVSGSGGGARMQEGIFSLMQMAKTSAALAQLADAKLPYISVCCDCTMGGVWASWAALGDVIYAEPRALIGFTGPRVIKTTINAKLPDGFQLSEFLLRHGQVDAIVDRRDLRARLAALLDGLLGAAPAGPTDDA